MNRDNKKPTGFDIFRSKERAKYKFVTKIKPHLLKIEIVLAIFAGAGYFFNINEIITVSLLLLSILYFFMCFAEFGTDSDINVKIFDFIIYLAYWGKSVIIVGILFAITNWPGFKMMLTVGIITQFLSLLVILYFIIKDKKDDFFSLTEFFRSLIVFSVAILLYFLISYF